MLLAFCTVFAAKAQPYLADTLLQQLRTETRDTGRVSLFAKLSRAYLYFKTDSAMLLAQQGLALSNRIGYARGQAICMRSIGTVFSVTGNYLKGMEFSLEALKRFEAINDGQGMATAMTSLANEYSDQGDWRKALTYSFMSNSIMEKTKNEFGILVNISNIGEFYKNMNKLDSARIYIQQAYEISLRRKDNVGIGIALSNLGAVFNKMEEIPLALEYYRASLPFQKEGKFLEGTCETTLEIAKIFLKRGQRDSAFFYAHVSYYTAQGEHFTSKLLDATQFITSLYKSNNQLDSAFVYQEKMVVAKDSMFSQEKVKQIQNLTFAEMIRQQEIESEKHVQERERIKNLQLLGIAVFIISLFIFILLLSRRKTKQRTIENFGVIALLLLFEFISLFIHPYISLWEHDNLIFMLLTLVAIAAIMVPLHHKLEDLMKKHLGKKYIMESQLEENVPPIDTQDNKEANVL